jgi:WD40 repeat protein
VPTVASFGDKGTSAITASEDGWLQTWGRFGGWAAGQYGVPVKNYPNGAVVSVSASQQRSLVLTTVEPARSANATVYDLRTGAALAAFRVLLGVAISPQLANQSPYVLWQDSDNSVRLYDISRSANTDRFLHKSIVHAAISADGKYVLTLDKNRQAHLWFRGRAKPTATVQAPGGAGRRRTTGTDVQRAAGPRKVTRTDGTDVQVIFSQDSRFFACLASLPEKPDGSSCRVFTLAGQLVKEVTGPAGEDWTAAGISPEGKLLATGGGYDGTLRIWDLTTGKQKYQLLGHTQYMEVLAFTPDGKRLLSASEDGLCRVWCMETGKEVCALWCYDNEWIVTTPNGRLDSSNLDSIPGISWVFPDAPFRALAPEVFLRDYFEPQLFERLMSNTKGNFRPVRPLAGLNRAQPVVTAVTVRQAARPTTAEVTVEIDPAEGTVTRMGKVRPSRSVHDLRLFRDGQLVAQEPSPDPGHLPPEGTADEELDAWSAATIVRPGRRVRMDKTTGKLTVTFAGVQVPARPGGPVAFSAYGFNEDRVKSGAGSTPYKVPQGVAPAQPRAYVVCVGVNDYGNKDFDLLYAAADARAVAAALSAPGRLPGYRVVPITLISDKADRFGTKEVLQAALALLAGPEPGAEAGWPEKAKALRALVPGGQRLSPGTPDDLVLVSFSGHGYTDAHNEFYLLPAEVGAALRRGERPSAEVLRVACRGRNWPVAAAGGRRGDGLGD